MPTLHFRIGVAAGKHDFHNGALSDIPLPAPFSSTPLNETACR